MPYPGSYQNRQKRATTDGGSKRAKRNAPDTVGKTENFFTCHVKLLTFLACLVVLLALFGPWNVYRIVQWYEQNHAQDNTSDAMTEEVLQGIIACGKDLAWGDFDGYAYELVMDTNVYIRRYDVRGGNYSLWVSSASEGEEIVSVLLVDMKNGYQETELKAVDD